MLGILAGKSGDQEAALRHLGESLDLAESLGDSDAKVAALNNLALAHESGGEPEEALKLAEIALALCVASGDRHREAALHNNLADLSTPQGASKNQWPTSSGPWKSSPRSASGTNCSRRSGN